MLSKSDKMVCAAVLAGLMFVACESQPFPRPIACDVASIEIQCVAQQAYDFLETIEDSYVKISGLSEFAIAVDTAIDAPIEQAEAVDLIQKAIEEFDYIADVKQKSAALSEILVTLGELSKDKFILDLRDDILAKSAGMEASVLIDAAAKSVLITARHDDLGKALNGAHNLPESQSLEENAKAIVLRKLAGKFAEKGDFETAREVIQSITMSITYYQAMARIDVARLAFQADKAKLAEELLAEADEIARAQDNGYFIGAALRDIGYSLLLIDENDRANIYFTDARQAASKAKKQNEKARATSRIATRLSDAKAYNQTAEVLEYAVELAGQIESPRMQGYSYYEISGSAAFSGEFDLARRMIELVPEKPLGMATTLKSAAMRDLAWGYARHGHTAKALQICREISDPREKMQAYSRVLRLMKNLGLEAPSRYL